jgi:hypothetical protein
VIGVKVTTETKPQAVTKAVEKAAFRNFGHAAARIRKDAMESIEKAEGPSPPGTPPHTRKRQLPRAIVFHNDKKQQEAIIGPRYSVVGTAGQAHEFGGAYKGEQFEERAFMFPALEKNIDRFASDWAGSVGE